MGMVTGVIEGWKTMFEALQAENARLRDDIKMLREALADQAAVQAGQVATKADVADVRNAITEVRGDVKLLKWMLGIFIAAAAPLVVRAYFGG